MVNPAAIKALAEGDISNFIAASIPGGIERQEAAAQQSFVTGQSFPSKMSPDQKAFEKMGFVFGDKIDELFVNANLPTGWSKKASAHSMHSDIIDEQGRDRVHIFYKGAFYDRRADARLIQRYTLQTLYPENPFGISLKEDERMIALVDGGKTLIKQSDIFVSERYDSGKETEELFLKELNDKFPDNRNPVAYWND